MLIEIAKSTASKNGGFVNTLTNEQVVETALGKSVRKTRFLFKSLEELKVNTKVEIDLGDFDIVPIKSMNEDTGEEITNNWLMPKVA